MNGRTVVFPAILMTFLLSLTCYGRAMAETVDKPTTASISQGAEFASGSYGTATRTRSLYLPFKVTWSPTEAVDVSVEVPYLYQSSSNVTTTLFRSGQNGSATGTVARGGPGGNSGGQQVGGPTASADSSVSGLGDIILRFGVVALQEQSLMPQVRPSLELKCPTADTAQGLGTGEFDVTVGLELTKWLGDLHLTGEGLFTYQGKAPGFDLKNYFSFTAGAGYQVTGYFEPMVLVKGATPVSSYATGLLEVRGRTLWTIDSSLAFDLYGSKGLADSSPDYGGGITVIYSF